MYATNLMWTASDLIFSGQLQKHPRLKFMLAEGGIGWFPYIWERMDQVWARHRYYQPIDFDTRPSDLFKKHFWGCYIEDEFGIKNRHDDRHRPHLRRDRLPALGQQLAQQPQGHRRIAGRRTR